MRAAKQLAASLRVAVVSLPCWEIFEEQDAAYRNSVLPPIPTLSVEAAAVFGWERFAHAHVGMTTFGLSAPTPDLMKHFGFTADNVALKVERLVQLFAGSPVPSPFGAVPRALL